MRAPHAYIGCLREWGLWVAKCKCGFATPGRTQKGVALDHISDHIYVGNGGATELVCGHPVSHRERFRDGDERFCEPCGGVWRRIKEQARA